MTVYAGNRIFATDINNLIAYADRQTNGTLTTTAEQGYLRLDSIPIVTGERLEIKLSPVIVESSVAGDLVQINLRGSTSGAATTSSTLLTVLADDAKTASGNQKTDSFSYLYTPGGSGSLSLLISYVRATGTGNVRINASANIPCQLWVYRARGTVSDTGVDV